MRKPMTGIALAALALLTTAACTRKPEAPIPPPRVVVERPQPFSESAGDVFAGSVRSRYESDLSFRVPGKLARRLVDAGQHVERGTLLATLDPGDASLNLASAKADLRAAEADLTLAKAEEKRYRDLIERGFVSRSLLDARINATHLAESRLAQARASLDLARNQSGYTELRADSAGTITAVLAEAGSVVAAGQAVLHFAQDGEREVRITVPENRVQALTADLPLQVKLWTAPDRQYQGRLREVAGAADAATRTFEARVSIIDPDDAVRLGASASVIVAGTSSEALFRLPMTALGKSDGAPVVWRVDGDGRAQPVAVRTVRYLNDAVIIAGPLSAEDALVSAGVFLLHPGMPVVAVDRQAARG